MRVRWTHLLPPLGEDTYDSSQAPLHWDGRAVLLPICHFEHDRETRVKDSSSRGYRFDVHRIEATGEAKVTSFLTSSKAISQNWTFLELADDLVLYVGTFHSMSGRGTLAGASFVDATEGAGRGVFRQHDDALMYADGPRSKVHCHDLKSDTCRWTLDLQNERPYRIGPIAMQGDELVAYGRDVLNFIEPTTGRIVRALSFPRIDKLYPPAEYEGDLLIPYTNGTSGGLLRFDPVERRIKWKFAKRGRLGPPRGGPLPIIGRTAIVTVNDGSSLIGVDLDTGKERWTFRAQWLYTPVEIVGRSIVFGTAGGYGRHLRRHDAETGETEWLVAMRGGCPYYANQGEHILAGDWGGVLRRIRRADGEVVAQIALGGPLATTPLVVGEDAFVLRWSTKGASPALVAITS